MFVCILRMQVRKKFLLNVAPTYALIFVSHLKHRGCIDLETGGCARMGDDLNSYGKIQQPI